jgi:hypothetical protein
MIDATDLRLMKKVKSQTFDRNYTSYRNCIDFVIYVYYTYNIVLNLAHKSCTG